jgi:hypothetical protein
MNTKPGPIVILGIGKDNKPRAGAFGRQEDTPVAMLVATAAMRNKVGRAETPEALTLVKLVPAGKAFASGKQLLPIIKQELFEKLLKALTLFDPTAIPAKPTTEAAKDTQDAAKPGPTSASQQPSKPAQPPTPGAKSAPTRDGKPVQPSTAANTRWIDPWSLVSTGSTVLYCADPKEGWWLCRVKDVSPDGRKLILQWRDFPKLPVFEARRIAVGLVGKIPA